MLEERFSIKEVLPFLSKELDFIFLGPGMDERCHYFVNAIKGKFRGKFVRFELDINDNALKIFEATHRKEYNLVHDGYLVRDLENYLRHLPISGKNICIEITGIQHQVLFFLTKVLLQKVKPARFFAVYTEPEIYDKSIVNDSYQLTEEFLGLRALPGFARLTEEASKGILTAFLGFEGNRFLSIYDSVQPATGRAIPIVGFPAFAPGWKAVALAANKKELEETQAIDEICFCDASSPFAAYKVLEETHKRFYNRQLIIAPLGTRPNALGSVLYILKHPGCALIYDHPKEKKYRSIGTRKCHVYHVSRFLM